MKKLFCMLFACLLFTGCAPTPKNPASLSSGSEKKPLRLARIDGALYYDCGEENTRISCGTMERILKKGAEPFSVPTEDGTVNFDGAHGYQNFAEDAKTVSTEDGWYIFKKIDTNRDITHYTHAYSVSGTMPNAAAESTFLVLAADDTITFAEAAKALFSSNTEDIPDAYILPIVPYYSWSIAAEASNVTPTGLTLTLRQSGGEATGTLQTGDSFSLQRLEGSAWMPIPAQNEPIFNSLAYLIPANGEITQNIEWAWLYGTLPPGQYKITKDIMDYRAPGDYDSMTVSADFQIS